MKKGILFITIILFIGNQTLFSKETIPVDWNSRDAVTIKDEVMREIFLPVLEENGVDLILCGHQHIYSRTAPMLDGSIAENGIIQIMTASGAKESYSPGDKEYIVKTAETPVYLIINAYTGKLDITAYDSAGEQFDHVLITKR